MCLTIPIPQPERRLMRPCPFCGRWGQLYVQGDRRVDTYRVGCAGCRATGPVALSVAGAKEKWELGA